MGYGKNSKSRAFAVLIFLLLVSACNLTRNTYLTQVPLESDFVSVTKTPAFVVPSPSQGKYETTFSPTPDPAHIPCPELPEPFQHTVLPGETLYVIADLYGINSVWLAEYNRLEDFNQVSAGLVLDIPIPELGSNFKIIPDSELVFGPASVDFDIRAFIMSKGGYLARYEENLDGKHLDSTELIELVSRRYSVNPRLLIALIEYQSGWLNDVAPLSGEYPLGYEYWWSAGLYKQLIWGANELNRGYYSWRAEEVSLWTLADHSMVMIDPTINAGTAGIQNLFSKVDGRDAWVFDNSQSGFFQTYFDLFGYPFDSGIEPLLPMGLAQPEMQLPFGSREVWAFTSGPHDGWDTGSPWAALDFAPPGEPKGCLPNDAWVVAIADGLIVYADKGILLLDLDGDGHEQTGWVVFYMHIENRDRVAAGTEVVAGGRLGHPSCEGGVATAAHVHIARRYNGEWIPATGEYPFVLDSWLIFGSDTQYRGYFQRDAERVDAWAGYGVHNNIHR